MPSFTNTVLAVVSLLAAAKALPANTSHNPAGPLNKRALGINCRGSGLCGLATIENTSGVSIMQLWHDVLAATDKSDDTVYDAGDHIVCISTSVTITVGASASSSVEGLTGSLRLSSDISLGTGGVCLSPQSASLTLGEIRDLVDALGNHGCKTCGSVPIHFVDEGSSDPSNGILTSNYAANPTASLWSILIPLS